MTDANGKVSIVHLVNRTGMVDRDIAKNAGISEGTLASIKMGRKVREKMIWRLINYLNGVLGTNYDLKDIEGIRY